MQAIITNQVSNAINYGNKKEMVSAYSAVGVINGELREVVTVRCYMGRSSSASVVYASIWVHTPNGYTGGKGKAGGYGYCKESAAIGEAITSAGIELSQSIDGRGVSAIREAMEAIAIACGVNGEVLIITHG
jgi:hypothetical protein